MRSTVIKGNSTGCRIDLGGDVCIIAEVIKIGSARDYLIYEVELSGAELLAFLESFGLREKYENEINDDEKYTVTSYDW